ncbi:VOC family protein [Streptomyces venezuelae]|uniref:VOC family protein n=1 Tax=Streptomyces venezuelae TaxID=54571 RepID=UPI0037D6A474
MLGTQFTKGSPCWIDLGSPDTEAAAAFYTGVFGWEFRSAGPDAGGYGFFQQDGKTVAALGPLTEEGARSAWTVYFHTPDADDTAKAAETAGATVRLAPFDVMDAGRMAALTDPHGAQFALWQPGTTKGLDRTSSPHTLVWVELHTGDPAAAVAFYRTVLGWRSAEMDAPGMKYQVLSTADGDQQDASFGGVAELQDQAEGPRWIVYFDVTDADAIVKAAQGNGGSVLMPAADIPDVGRIAWLADPFGAPFAVLKPAPMG